MRDCHTIFIVAILALLLLLASNALADPAPEITSFDIIAVCTGSDAFTSSCVDTSSTPYYITISDISGANLFVVTQQKGYASYQSATFAGNTVGSVRTIFLYDLYPIVSGFVDYWNCGSLLSGSFFATARSVNTNRQWNASIYINVLPLLSVTALGTGSGTVTADTGTLSWSGNLGTANYALNTPVILTPTALAGSSFDGWSGACTNTSGACAVTMDSNKSVYATFTVIPNARIDSILHMAH